MYTMQASRPIIAGLYLIEAGFIVWIIWALITRYPSSGLPRGSWLLALGPLLIVGYALFGTYQLSRRYVRFSPGEPYLYVGSIRGEQKVDATTIVRVQRGRYQYTIDYTDGRAPRHADLLIPFSFDHQKEFNEFMEMYHPKRPD